MNDAKPVSTPETLLLQGLHDHGVIPLIMGFQTLKGLLQSALVVPELLDFMKYGVKSRGQAMFQGVAPGARGASGGSRRAVCTCGARSSAGTVFIAAVLWAGLQLSRPQGPGPWDDAFIPLGFVQGVLQGCDVVGAAKLVANE